MLHACQAHATMVVRIAATYRHGAGVHENWIHPGSTKQSSLFLPVRVFHKILLSVNGKLTDMLLGLAYTL